MALEAAPDGSVYLGTPDGHIFASSDAGTHWELRGRVGTRTDAVVSRLLQDSGKPQSLFAAVWFQDPGKGGGVYRSDDGGRSWHLLGLETEAVRALEEATTAAAVLVAGTRRGVFRSKDAGKSWERISPVDDPELRNVDSVAIDPHDPDKIYAGTYHLPWKTNDGGKTWNAITAGLIDDSDIMSIRIDATKTNRLFLSACSGIYRSEDEGVQWTKLQGIPYAARRTQSIVQDPSNRNTLYAGTTEGLWVTRDGGESWKRTTSSSWVINTVVVVRKKSSGNGERVLLGTEAQGVLISEDAGEKFVASNEGFTHQVIRRLVQDPIDRNHLLIAQQSGGTQLLESTDAGVTWSTLPTGLEVKTTEGKLSTTTLQKVFGSSWGWIVRHRNGQFTLLNPQSQEWKEWRPRIVYAAARAKDKVAASRQAALLAPHLLGEIAAFANGAAFLAAREGLLRCDVSGSCEVLKAFGPLTTADALTVSGDGTLIAIATQSGLGISDDAGTTANWLPSRKSDTLWLDLVPVDGVVVVWLGTKRGIFVSKDFGNSWREAPGLPSGQLEHWLRGNSWWITALREGGVYVSGDRGIHWDRVDRDEERSPVTGIVETSAGRIVIGTQSEGVLQWK